MIVERPLGDTLRAKLLAPRLRLFARPGAVTHRRDRTAARSSFQSYIFVAGDQHGTRQLATVLRAISNGLKHLASRYIRPGRGALLIGLLKDVELRDLGFDIVGRHRAMLPRRWGHAQRC